MEPLDGDRWQAALDAQALAGRRVLALAQRRLPADHTDLQHADVAHGLTLLGVVGIIDPPRPEARQAIA